MKLTAIMILICCLQVSARSDAQNVSLSEKNASLVTVLAKIKTQTGYSFFYEDNLLLKGKPVTVSVSNLPVTQALDKIFSDQLLSYEVISGKMIVLKELIRKEPPVSEQMAVEKTISGTVLNDKGEPVEGANILEKNAPNTVFTDKDGNFLIIVKDDNAVLTVSHTSYVTQEIPVKGKSRLEVSLKTKTVSLDDVVVVGYQAVKRRDLTGAISTISSTQLKDLPVNSAAQALTGQLAGVQVATSDGSPGSPVKITVRGGSSITQDNSPLYIIDGIQVEDGLNSISPQDIETVTVLKDASSTAIYGARGANGVILITTKGGKPVKTYVSYNGFVGVNRLANKLSLMNPREFIDYQWERTKGSLSDSTLFIQIYGSTFDTLDVYRNKPFVDWQDELFGRTALTQTHNVSVTGGTQTTSFNISVTKNKEQSVMERSDFDRNLVNFRLDHRVSTKLKVGINFRYNNQTIFGGGTTASGASINGKLRHTIKYRPFLLSTTSPAELDQQYFDQTAASGMYLINPVQLNEAEYRQRSSHIMNINGYAEYSFTPYLSFRATAGLDRMTENFNTFDDYLTWAAIENSSGMPMVSLNSAVRKTVNVSNVLTFSNNSFTSAFHKKHRMQALLGQEVYMFNSNGIFNRLRYFPTGITPEKALAQLALGTSFPLTPSSTDSKSRLTSFFTRLNYTYNNKLLATFTMRADGSSKFAPGKQWGYFSSGSLAWRLSEESFIKNIGFIADLKIRASLGQAGNNRIGDFLFTSLYNPNNSPYGFNDVLGAGYAIPNLANPNIKWETTVSRNIGIDIGLLKNRLQLTLDAYFNDTKDLLINVPIATNSGYSSQIQNIGSTRNKGFEFSAAGLVVSTSKFKWNTNFNISFFTNRVKSLANGMNQYFANSGWGISGQLPDYVVRVGQPVGSMYGYVSDGFYTLDDFDYDAATKIYSLKKSVADNSAVIGVAQPGALKLKDLNGDGKIDADNDRQILGSAQPKFYGGFTNQFSYGNLDLSVFVNFTVGNKVFNGDKIEFSNAFNANTNMLAIMNQRWRTIDENGNVVQRLTSLPGGRQVPTGESPEVLAALNKDATIWQPVRGSSASFLMHSWAVEDASFLRVSNITLGYTFPKSFISRLKINSIRLYCTVNNLAVLTGYSGFDPEVSTKNPSFVTPGVDASPYPRSRSFLFGINAKF